MTETAKVRDCASIEDDEHFGSFLDLILSDAVRQPKKLQSAAELLSRGHLLVTGVEIDN